MCLKWRCILPAQRVFGSVGAFVVVTTLRSDAPSPEWPGPGIWNVLQSVRQSCTKKDSAPNANGSAVESNCMVAEMQGLSRLQA